VVLPGSTRAAAEGIRVERPTDPNATVEATVVLRRRPDGGVGADPDDLRTALEVLEGQGLGVVRVDERTRRIRIRGSVAQVSEAFGTSLDEATTTAQGQSRTFRHRTGDLTVPAALADRVIAVLGIDDRPQARTQFRAARAAAVPRSYSVPEIGAAYDFPAEYDGSGQSVAIIELGGGYSDSDLDTYFSQVGVHRPSVTAVGVDGAANQPGSDPQGADGEVLLDIEVVGALAPGADIVVYFAPNTDAGFLDAVSEALQANPTPAAVSISWGASEDDWTAQARRAMDSAFADAVALGVVVTAAAGDRGSSDGASDGASHVDFPASSPNVLACGGTRLEATGGQITSESVWNDGAAGGATGGGISDAFDRPPRQDALAIPGTGRGVPDVAGNADPQTGYEVLVDGESMVIGGTSAVSPLWAALAARLAQATGGPLTNFLDTLYAGAAAGSVPDGFRDITTGNNGAYQAGTGWDACTGLGSPQGSALLARLSSATPESAE
jgi:kumamolisin